MHPMHPDNEQFQPYIVSGYTESTTTHARYDATPRRANSQAICLDNGQNANAELRVYVNISTTSCRSRHFRFSLCAP